jgi:hypothetical protein
MTHAVSDTAPIDAHAMLGASALSFRPILKLKLNRLLRSTAAPACGNVRICTLTVLLPLPLPLLLLGMLQPAPLHGHASAAALQYQGRSLYSSLRSRTFLCWMSRQVSLGPTMPFVSPAGKSQPSADLRSEVIIKSTNLPKPVDIQLVTTESIPSL